MASKASAVWTGSLKEGKGTISTATGVLNINWGADNYDAADTYSDADRYRYGNTNGYSNIHRNANGYWNVYGNSHAQAYPNAKVRANAETTSYSASASVGEFFNPDGSTLKASIDLRGHEIT